MILVNFEIKRLASFHNDAFQTSQAKRHNITYVVYFYETSSYMILSTHSLKKELTLMGLMLLILVVNVTPYIIFQNQHAAYQQNN